MTERPCEKLETDKGEAVWQKGIAKEEFKLTPKEKMAFAFGMLRAIALVVGVFGLAYFAFIWFCIHVWFK